MVSLMVSLTRPASTWTSPVQAVQQLAERSMAARLAAGCCAAPWRALREPSHVMRAQETRGCVMKENVMKRLR